MGASAAAGTASASVIAAKTFKADKWNENPKLLELGAKIPAIEAEFVDAKATVEAIIKEWGPKWPLAPVEILIVGRRGSEGMERDIDGQGIERKGLGGSLCIISAKSLKRDCDRANRVLRRKDIANRKWWGRSKDEWEAERDRLEKALALARDYEARKAEVLRLSGIEGAKERRSASRDALIELVRAVMAEKETTLAGVAIKARAVAAWGNVEEFYRHFTVGSTGWGSDLAEAVLKLNLA